MAIEVERTFDLVYSLLHGNSTIAAKVATRIYDSHVPQKPTYLYILMEFASGSDVQGTGTARLMTRPLLLIRTVNKGIVTADMLTVDREIDSTLQNVSAVSQNGLTFSARRERPYRRKYYDDAKNLMSEIGGYFRFSIS